jgi:hypothetical protein
MSAQLTTFPPFLLPDVVSPPTDIATPPLCVTLPSHGAKTISLPLLHFLTTLHSVTSLFKSKSKHWIHTTAASHPLWTVWLLLFTAIKNHLNINHSPHHSTTSSFYLLHSQTTTPSKLYSPPLFPLTVVLHQSSLRVMTAKIFWNPTVSHSNNIIDKYAVSCWGGE